jgi:hypothetical protein
MDVPDTLNEVMDVSDTLNEVIDVPDTLNDVMDVPDTLNEIMDVPDTWKDINRFAPKNHCYRAHRLKRYCFCRLLISVPTQTILTDVPVDLLSPSK